MNPKEYHHASQLTLLEFQCKAKTSSEIDVLNSMIADIMSPL